MFCQRPLAAPVLLPLLSLLLAASALADEIKLKDGRILVGKSRKVGEILRIETLDGVVRVPEAEVERIRTDAELRLALERFAMRSGAGSCHAQLELARLARQWGLYDEMWAYLGRVERSLVARVGGEQEESEVMLRRTREFLGELEREVLPQRWRNASPGVKVRALLDRIGPEGVTRVRLLAITELLAKVEDADQHLRRRARSATNSLQRIAALRALSRREQPGNDTFLYRTAILDAVPQVRQAAMQITKELGRTADAVKYLAPGLVHDNGNFRIRTATAYGELGDAAALPLLVSAGPAAGSLLAPAGGSGGATRAHIAVMHQVSYVRDFDVEVAQASFIADPKIDVIHAGAVLDVTVAAVTTYRIQIVNAYRTAIRKIAASDPGKDPADWEDWLAERSANETAAATQPTTRQR